MGRPKRIALFFICPSDAGRGRPPHMIPWGLPRINSGALFDWPLRRRAAASAALALTRVPERMMRSGWRCLFG